MKKMNRLIALLLALMMLLGCVMGTLVSCVDPGNPDGDGDGDGDGGGVSGEKMSYTVKVKSAGGMAMSGVVVTVYADDTLEDLEGYATTDENGVATMTLKQNANYAIKLTSVPDGYVLADTYSFTGNSANITLTSKIIENTSLNGVTYSLGSIMRDFTATMSDGKKVTLSELLKTKDAVLINFWYTTCSWCVEEFPDMQAAYELYSDDIAIVALDPYTTDTVDKIEAFKALNELTIDMGQDVGLSTCFGVKNYPTSVIVDRYGAVCLVVEGAILGQKYFNSLFDHFTGAEYEQKLLKSYSDLAPDVKPDQNDVPTSEEVSAAINNTGATVNFYPETESSNWEYSWPFVVTEREGVKCIKASNSQIDSSYATLHADVTLKAGEAISFDYLSSTEAGADVLYVLVDGVNINTIGGHKTEWDTCFPYVATEDGTYKLSLVYVKDESNDVEEDTVYIKNLTIVDKNDITKPAYIPRWAATNPSDSGVGYDNYATVVLGDDGYYHVGDENGPLLLANVMGVTPFSDEDSFYSYIYLSYSENGNLAQYYDAAVKYCNYASNASINGLCTVDEGLKGYLEIVAAEEGFEENNPNVWLQFCLYYDAYGTDGEQLEDPIKGLAPHSAYETVLNETAGLAEYPNIVKYDRLIMPRGLWYEFTPEVSGAYRINSNVDKKDNSLALNGWVFLADGTMYYEYSINQRFVDDANNVDMYVYLEAGTTYYIDIAYYDVYQMGEFGFKIEYLGESYEIFRCVSPGAPFTYEIDENGEITEILIAGGVKVVYDETEDCYYNVLPDGTKGKSKIYLDFTMYGSIFGEQALYKLIEKGAFNFAMTENDHLGLIYLEEYTDEELKELWGEEYEANYEFYMLDDLKQGVYHGEGEDYTERMEYYYSQIIQGEDDPFELKGCVVVNKELAGMLQPLMDKYTFQHVENSWVKLCYYYESLEEGWEWIPNT